MLGGYLQLEKELGIEGYFISDESVLRCYQAKPTTELQEVLNILTKGYYNKISYDDLDMILIQVMNNMDLLVSTWEDDDEINDAVLIKTNGNMDVIKYVLMAVTTIDWC